MSDDYPNSVSPTIPMGLDILDARLDRLERLVLEMSKYIPPPMFEKPDLVAYMVELRQRHPDI